ncbi:MAG TPA: sodium:solute symporter [Vicinamibacteria bacterium]|jgi:SSS family solute:Na+ symporter
MLPLIALQAGITRLTALDLAIVALYFVGVFAIGFYFVRRGRNTADYFLASRDAAWWAIGASLFSANIGSEHFIGLAGSGAASGLAVGHFEWLASLIILVLGWIFVPFYLRSKVYTMPEFLERRYNRSCRVYLAGISLVAYVFTKIAVALFAGALVLQAVLGWSMWKSALALVVATGIYTVAGGLAAVIYTEVMQTVVLIVGALTLMFLGLGRVGGMTGLEARVPEGFFHMMKPSSHPDFPWTGIFFGAPILGVWYWCTDQVIVQRALAAKDEGHAKGGTVLAGFLKILPVFMLVIPGLVARALYPAEMAADSNSAFPLLVVRLMPTGLVGLMVAAMLAALMSSLSAVFNSSSTIFTMDFYRHVRPKAGERELVNVGRAATVIMVGLGLLWIPFMRYISNQLWIYLQSVQAYIAPPIAAVFLLGVTWKRANGPGALAALLTGFVLGTARFVLELAYAGQPMAEGVLRTFVRMNFLHFAAVMFVVCVAVVVGVSLATPAPAPRKVAGLTFATVDQAVDMGDVPQSVAAIPMAPESPAWRRRNMVLSGLLAVTIVSLWIYFR